MGKKNLNVKGGSKTIKVKTRPVKVKTRPVVVVSSPSRTSTVHVKSSRSGGIISAIIIILFLAVFFTLMLKKYDVI
jgi:hypothetical protein